MKRCARGPEMTHSHIITRDSLASSPCVLDPRQSKPKMGLPDMLSLQLSLVRFALRCATSEDERFTYADKVLGFCAQLLRSAVGEK